MNHRCSELQGLTVNFYILRILRTKMQSDSRNTTALDVARISGSWNFPSFLKQGSASLLPPAPTPFAWLAHVTVHVSAELLLPFSVHTKMGTRVQSRGPSSSPSFSSPLS